MVKTLEPCNTEQLFFEIEVNILPPFTEIEKSNCFGMYSRSDLNNKRKGNG